MSDKPIYHGRDHRQGGADPIHPSGGEGIRYDFDNVGDWLRITTTGVHPTSDEFGINLIDTGGDAGTGGININTTGFLNLEGHPGLLLATTGDWQVEADNISWSIKGDVGLMFGGSAGFSPHTFSVFGPTGTGGAVTEYLRIVTDGSGSLATVQYHMLSGTSWVADL